MFDLGLMLVAFLSAMSCLHQLKHLNLLVGEFRHQAIETEGWPDSVFQLMLGGADLGRDQRLLRTETLAASCLLILSFSCLSSVVFLSF